MESGTGTFLNYLAAVLHYGVKSRLIFLAHSLSCLRSRMHARAPPRACVLAACSKIKFTFFLSRRISLQQYSYSWQKKKLKKVKKWFQTDGGAVRLRDGGTESGGGQGRRDGGTWGPGNLLL